MNTGFSNFRFQSLMPSLQFRKMRFYGHAGFSYAWWRTSVSDNGSEPSAPTGSVPLLHAVKGVLGYREAVPREFPRGVARSTQLD
jgi:hypothetical protein